MVHIVDVLSKYLRPYSRILIGLLVLIIFIYAIRYMMNRRKLAEDSKYNDVANSTDTGKSTKDAVIYFFHADWCPHCKTAKPEWNAFKQSHDGKVKNGYKINCQNVDCTEDSNPLISEYKVDSYPTIKMKRDNTVIDFDSKVTSTALNSFTDVMLAD